jgi:hypothetical protein
MNEKSTQKIWLFIELSINILISLYYPCLAHLKQDSYEHLEWQILSNQKALNKIKL